MRAVHQVHAKHCTGVHVATGCDLSRYTDAVAKDKYDMLPEVLAEKVADEDLRKVMVTMCTQLPRGPATREIDERLKEKWALIDIYRQVRRFPAWRFYKDIRGAIVLVCAPSFRHHGFCM